MKANIHPTWYHDCAVTCSCGNKFTIGSVFPSLKIDICNQCHPFFTGEIKFVDRQGRVDRFKKKVAAAQAVQKTKTKAKSASGTTGKAGKSQSYREILRDQQQQLREAAKATQSKTAAAAN